MTGHIDALLNDRVQVFTKRANTSKEAPMHIYTVTPSRTSLHCSRNPTTISSTAWNEGGPGIAITVSPNGSETFPSNRPFEACTNIETLDPCRQVAVEFDSSAETSTMETPSDETLHAV